MKFSHDLARYIMLDIEKYPHISGPTKDYLIIELEKEGYSDLNEIAYVTKKLYEGGLIEKESEIDPQGTVTNLVTGNLTFSGHQLLDNIKDDSIWEEVKERVTRETSSASLEILEIVAIDIIKSKICNN